MSFWKVDEVFEVDEFRRNRWCFEVDEFFKSRWGFWSSWVYGNQYYFKNNYTSTLFVNLKIFKNHISLKKILRFETIYLFASLRFLRKWRNVHFNEILHWVVLFHLIFNSWRRYISKPLEVFRNDISIWKLSILRDLCV